MLLLTSNYLSARFINRLKIFLDMSEESYLDLNEVIVFGREEYKSDLVIDSIVRGIEAGDDFPAVQVRELADRNYEILDGHRRVVGHYIAGQPLKVTIIGRNGDGKRGVDYIDLGQTILVDDELIDTLNIYVDEKGVAHEHIASYRWLKERDLSYR